MAKGTRGGEVTREGAGDDCDRQQWWVRKQTPEAPCMPIKSNDREKESECPGSYLVSHCLLFIKDISQKKIG